MPVIGYLSSSAADYDASTLVAFRRGLGDVGYTEGRNVAIEYRFADAHYDRLTVLAADLIQLKVRVIVAAAVNAAHAAKAATTTIPIVFSISGDPVAEGLVSSLNRPTGNLTGGYDLFRGAVGEAVGTAARVSSWRSRARRAH